MSRSGYLDDFDCERWAMIRWRGAVESALKGRRGQAFLKELLAALDAMPEKKLIAEELESDGQVCALGAVGRARGIVTDDLDPEDYDSVASVLEIAPAMVREIAFMNDDIYDKTPEARFLRMRNWVQRQIRS